MAIEPMCVVLLVLYDSGHTVVNRNVEWFVRVLCRDGNNRLIQPGSGLAAAQQANVAEVAMNLPAPRRDSR